MKTTTIAAMMPGGQPDLSNLFNPFVLWTDLGMRAAEAMVESTQNLTDGADRLTRAVASADSAGAVDTTVRAHEHARATPSADLGGIEELQRTVWELMTHNWLAWISAVSQLMSAGAGVRLAHKVAGQDNPLEAARDSLRPVVWEEEPAAETKPRRKAAVKSRRTRRAH